MIEQILSPELVQALGWTLVHSLWQAAAFALGLGALLVALRKFSARARYNMAISTLAAFFLTVVLTFGGLYEAPLAPRSIDLKVDTPFVGLQADARDVGLKADERGIDLKVDTTGPSFQSRMANYYNEHLPLIVTLWLMGVLFLQLRFMGQLAYLQRLKNYGTERFPAKWAPMLQELEAAIGISKPVRYLSSFRVGSPFTAGWLRPVVLFPAALLDALNEPELRTIMAHELAHIKRHDFLVNLAQTLLCILFFYHPAVWWMSSRIEEEREHCCDDLAIAVTGERIGYAKTLIQLKEAEATPQMALGYLGRGGGFKQRVTRLLSGYLGTGTYGEGFTSAVIIAGIMVMAVTLSGQQRDKVTATDAEVSADAELPVAGPVAPAPPERPERPEGNYRDSFYHNTDPKDFVMPAEDSTALNLLLEACEDGNVELARFLLKQGVDINEVDVHGWTPLMVAAGKNQVEVVKLLIAAGADVNYVNRYGWTALIEAADEGSYESAEVLLTAGADVNLTGPGNNRTPLAMAASEGKTRVFALLVQKGADIFSASGEGSPLHEAAEEGKLDIVKRLIDLGADAGARDEDGRAPLSYAAEEGKLEVVRYLLKNGANPNDIDDDGRTALMYAAHETQTEVTNSLLEYGAQAKMKDKRGRNALDYAAEELGSMGLYWKHTDGGNRPSTSNTREPVLDHPIGDLIRALIKAGATSDQIGVDGKGIYVNDKGWGWIQGNKGVNRPNEPNEPNKANAPNKGSGEYYTGSPFGTAGKPHAGDGAATSHELVDAVARGQNDRIDYLIGRGDNLNGITDKGRTPLTEASFHGYNVHTLQLVKGGADINRVDGNGYTPLTMAALHNHTSTVRTLLEMGADPDRPDGNGMVAKDFALRESSPQILRLLNSAGSNVMAVSFSGTSPLEEPARNGDTEILRFFLEQGADPNGGAECPSVFYAAQEGHPEAVALLARYEADLEKGCDYRDSDFFNRNFYHEGLYAVYENATPLMVALTQLDAKTTAALLKAGAQPNHGCRKHQFRSAQPIDVALAGNLTASELGDRYERVFNVSGWTPLMEAVMTDKPELVKLLLDAGADKARSVTGGMTALSLAREIKNNDVIRLLAE